MIYDCIIVGAGAAGLFCGAAAGSFVNGLILEKTGRPGTKLLMSGGGQCNITHSGSVKDFAVRYGKNGSRIRSCLYKFNNLHLQTFLRENGIETIAREDGKVFPKSMKARDILHMLQQQAFKNGFQIRYNAPVIRITRLEKENCWCAETKENAFLCRNLVIASGGCSYPSTGSDGNLFPILKRDLNLLITPPRPALTPVFVENYPYGHLTGISFEHAELQLWQQAAETAGELPETTGEISKSETGKTREIKNSAAGSTAPAPFRKTGTYTGPLLMTSDNFSGPLILNASRDFRPGDRITLNYLYPLKKEEVLARINSAAKNSSARLSNLLPKALQIPKSFAAAVIEETGEKPKAIAAKLTEDTFTVSALGGFHKAMATAGGVALSEINPKTMECKAHQGLYIIGEALDIDGETGGYNLQFAYSSACAAAADICNSL